jgi:C4-dicarboxylate-specific signal transduction histidine kinase
MDDRREQVDMNEVVVHALKLLHTELGTQGISVHMDLAADLPTIHGNSNQLHQLIYNLAHNAAKALSEARTGRGTIEIATRTQKGSIIVEVQDNGPGIDADKIDSAFEPFVTSKKHGMGLGLAICRKIAERHGGQIGAMPVRPHGTRVRIQLERRDNTKTW